MIDNFALGLTHALMLLTALILLRRPELDDERQGGGRGTFRKPPR